MGLTRADLTDMRYSEADRADFRALYDRYMECDKWAKRALKNTGVLITSHPGNRPYLKACIESHKKLNMWITLVYDNYFDANQHGIPYEKHLPSKEVMNNIDTFIMPHHQTWGGVLYPYFWLLWWGAAAMGNFEYVYCTNGDCIIEKPENFNQIVDLLGDNDIVGCGWEPVHEGSPAFNTTAFLAKTDAIKKIMKHFADHFIPFDNYEKYTQDFGNCERRFGIAIEQLGLKNVIVPENPYNTQLHKKGYGTWCNILGFRHIHAEHGYAYKHRLEPPELKYFDGDSMGHEYRQIKAYWDTKDPKELEKWWPVPPRPKVEVKKVLKEEPKQPLPEIKLVKVAEVAEVAKVAEVAEDTNMEEATKKADKALLSIRE